MNEVQFPTITVGDRSLVVRYSIAAQVLMKRRGIDPRNLLAQMSPFLLSGEYDANGKPKPLLDANGAILRNPACEENILTVFSACVAENVLDQSNPDRFDLNKAPTADYWMTQLGPLQFSQVEAVIGEAMGKVLEEQRHKLKLVAAPPEIPSEKAS